MISTDNYEDVKHLLKFRYRNLKKLFDGLLRSKIKLSGVKVPKFRISTACDSHPHVLLWTSSIIEWFQYYRRFHQARKFPRRSLDLLGTDTHLLIPKQQGNLNGDFSIRNRCPPFLLETGMINWIHDGKVTAGNWKWGKSTDWIFGFAWAYTRVRVNTNSIMKLALKGVFGNLIFH